MCTRCSGHRAKGNSGWLAHQCWTPQNSDSPFAVLREDHQAMIAAGANKLFPDGQGSSGFITEKAVQWAAVMLLSRAFSLDLQEEAWDMGSDPDIALVPWADMLNHSSAAGKGSCLVYNPNSRIASLHAHRSYNQGEQVYDSYGPGLSPSKLFLDYGFVDSENHNHAVDLPASTLGPVKSKANEAFLEAIGLPIGGAVFTVTSSGVDESVMAWTRAAVASKEEMEEAGWREGHHNAPSIMLQFLQPTSQQNELEMLHRLLCACEGLLSKYPTTLAQDEAAIAVKGSSLPPARRQVLRALMSEKLALQGACHSLSDTIEKLHSGIPCGSLYP
ncbi:unnamed protein product [Sphagnum balticum]